MKGEGKRCDGGDDKLGDGKANMEWLNREKKGGQKGRERVNNLGIIQQSHF